MKINEIIKTKRLEIGLTQEQVAKYLNVSTPAVNKWEAGTSHPDITILPALGRLLGVDMNTLLSFKEDLTASEIGLLANKIMDIAKEKGYTESYDFAMKKLKEFPNNDMLTYNLALTLKGALMVYPTEDQKTCEEKLDNIIENLIDSDNIQIKDSVRAMLISKYLDDNELDKAEELIGKLDSLKPLVDKEILLSKLYFKKKDYDKACELLENKIFQTNSTINSHLVKLMEVSFSENNLKDAKYFADLSYKFSELFELSNLDKYSAYLGLALLKKDIKETLYYFNLMLQTFINPNSFKNPTLYKHTKISESYNNFESKEEFIKMMINQLKTDEEYSFLRESEDFNRLIGKYDTI
ncbi:helix-turn-helix domain-containing protein [Miniphocaeibacter massiliensis]|uniref:helix-turn-helix domain-containing protein n=1 Tax=Miniphocaeibacter massiliensis TaxID=2041841 RepID=UPI000C1B91A6|nr:helix-turn-helix transcriptional regulator [Miniphocaeibacter massiliensis]